MKNLFLGYFHTPVGKRTEVIRLISKVLIFNKDEMDQVCQQSPSSIVLSIHTVGRAVHNLLPGESGYHFFHQNHLRVGPCDVCQNNWVAFFF